MALGKDRISRSHRLSGAPSGQTLQAGTFAVDVDFGRCREPCRRVPKTGNTRVRSSGQRHASGPARHTLPKGSPPCPSFLVLPGEAHEVFEVHSPPAPEYPSQKQLRQHHDARKDCLGDISHELKAPISRIRVLLERARRSPQEVSSYLARIEENVFRMEALTKRLLDFSRMEFTEESLLKEPCDLAEVIGRVVEDARIEAEARGCTIEHSIVAECLAFINYELLHRAVENVVRNSVQYTRKNSSVSVALSCPSSSVAQIVVEDEGPGISEEELEHVFKPFYRAAHARANGTLGAGLGLAISERALKLHGGSIKARNRSHGRGLQVTMEVPLLNKSETSAFPSQENQPRT